MRKKIIFTGFLSFFLFQFLLAQGIDKPRYEILTKRAGNILGTFKIELFPLIAPNHTRNFDSLVTAHAYDSTAFHRVVPGFVIQGGDPNSINGPISTWGQGNANQPTVNAEFSAVRHLRGIIGAARDANINSANSQFYICVANATFLDGQYTVYGKVTEGMSVVDTIVNAPRDANDVPLQKIEMFVNYIGVNDTIPNTPSLTSPANNTLNINNNQNFNWTAVSGAVLYTAEFSTDSTFTTIAYTKNSGVNSTGLPNVLGSTKYFWRVKANNGGHESSYSSIRSFTTKAAPNLIYPGNLDTGIVLSPVCKWTSVPGATSYLLQIASNTSFNSASLVYFQAGITDTTKQASGLLPNTTYYWRVRGNQGTSQGLSSQVNTFTTGVSVGNKALEIFNQRLNIRSIYPNPANKFYTVSIHSQYPEKIRFELLDALGKSLQNKSIELLAGSNLIEFSIENFKPGAYVVKLTNGDNICMKKLFVE